jgi:hypothetical protein
MYSMHLEYLVLHKFVFHMIIVFFTYQSSIEALVGPTSSLPNFLNMIQIVQILSHLQFEYETGKTCDKIQKQILIGTNNARIIAQLCYPLSYSYLDFRYGSAS